MIMQPTSTPVPARDFSGRAKAITFTADGDTFYGVPRVATGLLTDVIAGINRESDMIEKVNSVIRFFDITLIDESAALMRHRLNDKNNPIDLDQALDIIGYLVEVHGGRPTPPSSSSSDGLTTEETGTSSTAGAPSEVSIPWISPSTVS